MLNPDCENFNVASHAGFSDRSSIAIVFLQQFVLLPSVQQKCELILFVLSLPIWPFPPTFISSFCCVSNFCHNCSWLDYEIDIFEIFSPSKFVLHSKQINYAEFVGNSVLFGFWAMNLSFVLLHHMVPGFTKKWNIFS